MEGENPYLRQHKITLKRLKQLPENFSVTITEDASNHPECVFEISKINLSDNSQITREYKIFKRDHSSYLNLFEKLSVDFGLRLPQNRRQEIIKPSFNCEFREVLTENLHPEMLYGYGDPAVIRVEKGLDTFYYLLSTSNDAAHSFPILRSKNLQHWEHISYVFPQGKKPAWAADGEYISDYWAPEMHLVNNEFRTYFVARDKTTSELCIGVAKSHQPEGLFIACKNPLLKGNVIDPHIYVENNSTSYLLWKQDNNDVWPGLLLKLLHSNPKLAVQLFDTAEDQLTASFILTLWPWVSTLQPMERFFILQVFIEAVISNYTNFYNRLQSIQPNQPSNVQKQIEAVLHFMKTPIYIQPLSADGLELIGEQTKIMENDLEWEAHLVEGMWLTRHEEKCYLFYAGNDFSTNNYGIGVAIADTLLGPYKKMQTPLLQSTGKWRSPGHPSVTKGSDGKLQLFFHAYYPEEVGYKKFRALLAIPIECKGDTVSLG